MTTAVATATRPRGLLNGGLWFLQVALALAFTFAGLSKLLMSPDQLAGASGWEGSLLMIRFIGTAELLGAIGLVAPSLTRIRPELTPLAALGLIVVMLLAAGVHLGRDEIQEMMAPLTLAVLLVGVWWGRGRALPIPPRTAAGVSGRGPR